MYFLSLFPIIHPVTLLYVQFQCHISIPTCSEAALSTDSMHTHLPCRDKSNSWRFLAQEPCSNQMIASPEQGIMCGVHEEHHTGAALEVKHFSALPAITGFSPSTSLQEALVPQVQQSPTELSSSALIPGAEQALWILPGMTGVFKLHSLNLSV